MMDRMEGMRRTVYCGEVSLADAGKRVVVAGFVQKTRELGKMTFIDLRDRTGIVQLSFDGGTDSAVFQKAGGCRAEYVLMAGGVVRERESKNKEIPTGDVEIYVDDLRVLSKAETPPFEISGKAAAVREELRLKYRYLDLRRGAIQRNLIMRHEIARVTRAYFYENGFLEIETPIMMKSTPEGARDYLVPSRTHPGSFYALPQSPQIYKQLLMVAGYDRYIQLARSFRDEDLRADRQPEFTQIDLEMSFVDQEDVLEMLEGFIQRLMRDVLHREIQLPLTRMTYGEAMERFGSDKPDTRFGMEIIDISALAGSGAFPVFAEAARAGGTVRAIVAKGAAGTLSRKAVDKLTAQAKGIGAKGLAFIRWADEQPGCSFSKFLREGELEAYLSALGLARGDVALIAADKAGVALPVLGQLRLTLGRQLGLIPKDRFDYLWITEFPFFEYDEESAAYVAMHHPFTMPLEECLPFLESDPGSVRAKAYDLVLNGTELCSGSIRITDYALQEKMFRALGLTDEEIEAKFGFLVEAYRYASPPHGGVGLGLDRLVMALTGAESLRDVVAFPKVQNASELMSGCPAPVESKALDDLGIRLADPDGRV